MANYVLDYSGTYVNERLGIGLATASSDGLMSSTDKMTLDTLSGGTKEEKTITDIGSSILIDDALPEELLACEFTVYPAGDVDNPTGGGNNLLNPATNIQNYYISSGGVNTASQGDNYSDLIPVSVGDEIYFYGDVTLTKAQNKRMHGYNAQGKWVKQLVYASYSANNANHHFSCHATITSGIAYVRVSYTMADINVMVAKGSEKSYERYRVYDARTSTTININDTLYTINLPSNFYMGTIDLINGTATQTYGMIAAYNGETLPGKWISTLDEYRANTTPTNTAQVIYELATPVVSSITGYNNIILSSGLNDFIYNDGIIDLITYYASSTTINSLTITGNGFTIAGTTFSKTYLDSIKDKADIDSPYLTGTPKAPTPAWGDSSARIATTAYVMAAIHKSIRITVLNGFEGLSATATLRNSNYSVTAPSNASGIISIPVTELGVYDITYSNAHCRGDDVAEVTSSVPVEISAIYAPDVVYTICINESSSNPATSLYYDDAVGMTKGSSDWDSMPIFNGIRPCVFKDGQVNYYLNPNNFGLKADGTPSVLTGEDGDVMIEIRKFGYQLHRETIEGETFLFVSVTNIDNYSNDYGDFSYAAFSRLTEGDLPKFYQGAYLGSIDNDGNLRSVVAKVPANTKTIAEFRAAAQQRNTVDEVPNVYHYQQNTFFHITALQCLYLIKYGNRNGQEALGKGIEVIANGYDYYLTGYGLAAKANGTLAGVLTDNLNTNQLGMDYGTTTNTQEHMKLFGIEDFWGNCQEFVEGVEVDANYNFITSWNSFSGEGVTASSYTTSSGRSSNLALNFIQNVSGTNNSGFLPVAGGASGTSSSTYWADKGAMSASSIGYFSGNNLTNGVIGPFLFSITATASYSNSKVSARLSYN